MTDPRIEEWNQKALDGSLTPMDVRDYVAILRAGRNSAAPKLSKKSTTVTTTGENGEENVGRQDPATDA